MFGGASSKFNMDELLFVSLARNWRGCVEGILRGELGGGCRGRSDPMTLRRYSHAQGYSKVAVTGHIQPYHWYYAVSW